MAVFAPQWEDKGAEQFWVVEHDACPERAQQKAAGKEVPSGTRTAQRAKVQLKHNPKYLGYPLLIDRFSKLKYKL